MSEPALFSDEWYKQKLEKALNKYEKICENLENLNDEAFELEKEIMYLRRDEEEA